MIIPNSDKIDERFNPLKLKFHNPGPRVENIILYEILNTYKCDTWGLNPNNVLFEIGANTGAVSMTCAMKYGCKVIAYEPLPATYEKLERNVNINGLSYLIETYPLAITKDGRDVRMYQNNKNSGASNIYNTDEGPIVKSVALREAVRRIKLQGYKIQVVLMDCEGAEFELIEEIGVLRGIPLLRGEFHASWGDTAPLLKRAKEVIPNTIIEMQPQIDKDKIVQYRIEQRKKHMETSHGR